MKWRNSHKFRAQSFKLSWLCLFAWWLNEHNSYSQKRIESAVLFFLGLHRDRSVKIKKQFSKLKITLLFRCRKTSSLGKSKSQNILNEGKYWIFLLGDFPHAEVLKIALDFASVPPDILREISPLYRNKLSSHFLHLIAISIPKA
jgi:hypothetical protein